MESAASSRPRKPARTYSGARRTYSARRPNKPRRTSTPKKATPKPKDTSPEIQTSVPKRAFERPRSPLNLADTLTDSRLSFGDEPLNLTSGNSSQSCVPLLAQISQESTHSADADSIEKSSGSVVLTAVQLRENRLKFQRQRALKAVGKYNAELNLRRNTERKFYYDLQTNIYHVPRRVVSILRPNPELLQMKHRTVPEGSVFVDELSGSPKFASSPVSAYPTSLTISPPQFADNVPMLSGRALSYFPLRTAVNVLPPNAAQFLHMSTESYRKRKAELYGDTANSSDEECSLFDDEEKKSIQKAPSPLKESPPDDESAAGLSNEPPSIPMEALPATFSHSPAPTVTDKRRKSTAKGKRSKLGKMEVDSMASAVMVDSLSEASDRLIFAEIYDQEVDIPPPDSCYVCHVKDKVPPSLAEAQLSETTSAEKMLKKEPAGDMAEPLGGAKESGKKKKGKSGESSQEGQTLSKQSLLECTKCKKKYHPSCVNLPKQTLLCMKKYPWECSECKNCHKCKSSAKEDKMMFCDLCDRGYHSFCVGVPKVPSGRWLCEQCAICSICGSARANEEGKRGRACIWQLEWDEDDDGNVTDVRTLCYPCFNTRRQSKRKGSAAGATVDSQDHNEDSVDAPESKQQTAATDTSAPEATA